MEEKNWLELLNQAQGLKQLQETNQYTEQFGLRLSEEDTALLMEERNNTLQAERRVEFGPGILPRLIYEFCDSAYLSQDSYRDTLIRLQEIFFRYKNEMLDEITDDELLHFMREQFDDVCCGDLDYLEGTCLEVFAGAIRAGYGEYQATEGRGAFSAIDPVRRWDRDLYLQALQDLF